jgi:hypothetical protein
MRQVVSTGDMVCDGIAFYGLPDAVQCALGRNLYRCEACAAWTDVPSVHAGWHRIVEAKLRVLDSDGLLASETGT